MSQLILTLRKQLERAEQDLVAVQRSESEPQALMNAQLHVTAASVALSTALLSQAKGDRLAAAGSVDLYT